MKTNIKVIFVLIVLSMSLGSCIQTLPYDDPPPVWEAVGNSFWRAYDLEYGVVCYTKYVGSNAGMSCLQVER